MTLDGLGVSGGTSDRILRLLREASRPMTVADLIAKGVSVSASEKALPELCRAGLVRGGFIGSTATVVTRIYEAVS